MVQMQEDLDVDLICVSMMVNDVGIVAEYTGKVEGEGGENLGSSTASVMEGETKKPLFVMFTSL